MLGETIMSYRIDRRKFLASLTVAGAALPLWGSVRVFAQQPSSSYPASYDQIIEGSKAENQLVLYSTLNSATWSGIKERFSALYPWIDVEVFELDSGELVERYFAERGAGVATADFLATGSIERSLECVRRNEVEIYRVRPKGLHCRRGVTRPAASTRTS